MGTMHHIFFFVPHPSKGHERVLDNIKFRGIKRGKLQPGKRTFIFILKILMT